MSSPNDQNERRCISSGINVSGTNAASFDCPKCGYRIHRSAKVRKQSTLYECPECGFTGP